jgi:hypothetical protein
LEGPTVDVEACPIGRIIVNGTMGFHAAASGGAILGQILTQGTLGAIRVATSGRRPLPGWRLALTG